MDLPQDDLPVDKQLCLPASHAYFDGHFIDNKILPAVAQISLCLESYFDQDKTTSIKVSRARFFNVITPDVPFEIRWKHKGSKLMSELYSPLALCSRVTFSVAG
jgi:3-hydroxymyristoyl/3-hydroxydecanoyl-(acyl carrier protein) dehydratase